MPPPACLHASSTSLYMHRTALGDVSNAGVLTRSQKAALLVGWARGIGLHAEPRTHTHARHFVMLVARRCGRLWLLVLPAWGAIFEFNARAGRTSCSRPGARTARHGTYRHAYIVAGWGDAHGSAALLTLPTHRN